MPVKQSIKEREERRREHVDSLVLARMLELITEDPEVQEEGFEFEMFVLYTADCLPFRPLHNFLNASKTKKSFDRLDELPDAIWNSLIDKGIKKALWDRLWSTVDRLNQALLFGLTGLTPPEQVNMVLGAPEGLDPSSIVVNYCPYPLPSDLHLLTPVAFFRRRVGYKYCTRIETYVDIYESLNNSREAFDQLVCTVYESGLESPTWLGDQMITEIALILLEDLGYMCKGDATDFQLDKVMSMGEMLEKGDVFVCKCCPDVERVEMDWKGLVQHFADEERKCRGGGGSDRSRAHNFYKRFYIEKQSLVCTKRYLVQEVSSDTPKTKEDDSRPVKYSRICEETRTLFRDGERSWRFMWK